MRRYTTRYFREGFIQDFLKCACPTFEGAVRRLVNVVYGKDADGKDFDGKAPFFDLWAATEWWLELSLPKSGYVSKLMAAARTCFLSVPGRKSLWSRNRNNACHALETATHKDCCLIIMMLSLVSWLTGFVNKSEIKTPEITTAYKAFKAKGALYVRCMLPLYSGDSCLEQGFEGVTTICSA